MEETVEVTIKPDGSVEIHVTGVDGMACLSTTEELVTLLGGQVESQELTSEAYNVEAEEQQDRLWH
ncbi:DUF2997 domain-containing protein [Actinomadura sp. LD22]|uniref:DUF2997 domain-containing protein n=1 Tax=Actinomadura physcomitrii TaxID=2650748 RepID=A0A6I4MNL5_9ACTN|nr:DUF2997 domain-containing protein [Actinomadura physcomitrii]MWA07313.1 DUF2997 domain-containing protein [Actinomadura physcomitrii]